jgi:predicted dehydrogenase
MAAQCSGAVATTEWREAVAHPDVDIIIVSTTNNWLAPIAMAAV